ncbi:polysaccharide chain length determinant protein [Azoarcus olearius]|uniref:XrtA system polysaccharide chain length determinant n=1 Tax=Azoarcus sp. (strain BH72) TaxID=418699 RepID=UPI0008061013|nr:XrtA system polysaccharide chain length determinant [Azoarcus olearius]ANQ86442.1 polysaccharide chain length determinant protein [Azoarcus olearius]
MEELVGQLVGYLRGMWRFRWWGLALAWVVGIGGCIAIYMMPDKYESTARVFVDTQSILRPLMSGIAVQPNVDQQVAILSRTLINRPNVEKLITMADLDLGVRTQGQREALISELTNGLRIRGTGRDNLFTLAYADTRPDRAQRIVQSLVSLFVESGLGTKRQDTDSARRFIEDQIRNYEEKLTEAENRMKEFRLKNIGLLSENGQDHVAQISQLASQLDQARLELREAENSRDALRAQLVGEEPVLLPQTPTPSAVSIPEIDGRIDALKRNLDDMMQRYTDQHPDVIGAKRVIEQLEKQKLAEIEMRRQAGPGAFGALNTNPVFQQMKLALAESEARVASLRARVGEYESRLAQARAASRLVPELEAELAQLNRDYAVHKSNYDSLVARRESANIAVEMDAQSAIAEFRLIDPPSLPSKPSAPNRLLLMPLAGLAGLLAGFALTFLISQFRPAFSDARMLREITGLPVLGTVSMLDTPERARTRMRGLAAFSGGVVAFVGATGLATFALHLIQR